MFSEEQRPVDETEAKRLKRQVSQWKREGLSVPKNGISCGLTVAIPLSLLVFFANPRDPVNRWGAPIMFVIYFLIAIWAGASYKRELTQRIQRLDETIREGMVIVTQVSSGRCFKVCEVDDEGSEYYFEVDDNHTVIISDVDIWSRRFPNNDFTITRILDLNGHIVDQRTVCNGKLLTPMRIVKRSEVTYVPGHVQLQLIPGTLEDRLGELGVL